MKFHVEEILLTSAVDQKNRKFFILHTYFTMCQKPAKSPK